MQPGDAITDLAQMVPQCDGALTQHKTVQLCNNSAVATVEAIADTMQRCNGTTA